MASFDFPNNLERQGLLLLLMGTAAQGSYWLVQSATTRAGKRCLGPRPACFLPYTHGFSRGLMTVLCAGDLAEQGAAAALWSSRVSLLAIRCPAREPLPGHWLVIYENSLRGCLHPGGELEILANLFQAPVSLHRRHFQADNSDTGQDIFEGIGVPLMEPPQFSTHSCLELLQSVQVCSDNIIYE